MQQTDWRVELDGHSDGGLEVQHCMRPAVRYEDNVAPILRTE